MNEVLIRIDRGDLQETFIRNVLLSALNGLGFSNAEVSVMITGDREIRELNRYYRGKDNPTDVLSFPMGDEVGGTYMLGDIVISYDTAIRQAEEAGISLHDEFTRLLVHGLVHLLGYDHELGEEEEQEFLKKEREVYALLESSQGSH